MHCVYIACIAMLIKEDIICGVQSSKTLLDIVIYMFAQFMQIMFTLIQNTGVCKHYRGSYHMGLVLFTMVCVTFDGNPYNGRLCQG